MVRRIIALGAAGALVIVMLPGVASAARPNPYCTQVSYDSTEVPCTTAVTLSVGTGTAIIVPLAFSIGSGMPGQDVESTVQTVEWNSNETTLAITVQLSDLVSGSNAIEFEDVYLREGASTRYFTAAPLWVKNIVHLQADSDHQDFYLGLKIPGAEAPEGTYAATLTFGIGAQP
jgi:hypothetical protein